MNQTLVVVKGTVKLGSTLRYAVKLAPERQPADELATEPLVTEVVPSGSSTVAPGLAVSVDF